jgi:hypothetical protein
MKHLPPSPCKVCGSKNHWDKECPDFNIYNERLKRNAKFGAVVDKVESDKAYHSAYSILLNQILEENEKNFEGMKSPRVSDFKMAAFTSLNSQITEWAGQEKCKTTEETTETADEGESRETCVTERNQLNEHIVTNDMELETLTSIATPSKQTTSLEEIEDEHWESLSRLPVTKEHLLEDNLDWDTELKKRKAWIEIIEDEYWESQGRMPTAKKHLLEDESEWTDPPDKEAEVNRSSTHQEGAEEFCPETAPKPSVPKPPKDMKPTWLNKWHSFNAGSSAVGISVLSMKGWIGNINNGQTDLRIDSCADVTVISEDYYNSLKYKPTLQQGLRM